MRVSTLSLNVRSDTPPQSPQLSSSASLPPDQSTAGQPSSNDKAPVYTSLLSQDPYKPPSVLSGLPIAAKHSVPSNYLSGEFRLTPDTLRFLGKTVSQVSGQIREVLAAQRGAEARVALQLQEQARLCDKCREINQRIASLRQRGLEERLQGIRDAQNQLLARTDRILRAMMAQASPELSEHETNWFQELKRMQEQAAGLGRYDADSLNSRTRLVSNFHFVTWPNPKNAVTA
jgi:nucleoporin NUP82